MSIRKRLEQLELRVQPAKPVCTRRNEPDLGEFFRAKFGDEEAQKRYEESEDPGECHCEDCQKRRREQDADPQIEEFHRFFEAEYGKYDADHLESHVLHRVLKGDEHRKPT